MKGDKLPREYFDLVRDVLIEEKSKGHDSKRPLKQRKIRTGNSVSAYTDEKRDEDQNSVRSHEVVNIGSDDDGTSDFSNKDDEDEYDSEDFEDVTYDTNMKELSISFDVNPSSNSSSEKKTKKSSRNALDPVVKQYRKTCHIFILLCLLCHSFIRNRWCNDEKLQRKLSKIIPDDVFENLHPKRDEDLPLRSTRKLLDALRSCMKIWNNKFRQELSSPYEYTHLYMVSWNYQLQSRTVPVDQKIFKKLLTRFCGPINISVQGFVTMLRGCGLNARLVHNVQVPDFTDHKSYPKKMIWKIENDCLKFPIYWCEVWDKFSKQWITVDIVGQQIIETVRNKSKLEPIGRVNTQYNMMRYIVAYDRKLGCKDISRRYISQLQNKNRKKRITKEPTLEEWYDKLLASLNKRKENKIDAYEEEYFETRDQNEGIPDSLEDMKNHPFYVLESNLRSHQVLRKGAKHCGFLRLRNKKNSLLKVYNRIDVIDCYSARHWYMRGRVLKKGAKFLLTVKVKVNHQEEEEEERLYPFEETEYFIPKQVESSGKIPTNVYGNIDVYRPWMIPIGCCLIEGPTAIRAAKFLGIPFAKAVTSFKFERGRKAKPTVTGIVVELEYTDAICLAMNEVEQCLEDERHTDLELNALNSWSLLLKKLRIKSKLADRHGPISEADFNENDSSSFNSQQKEGSDLDVDGSLHTNDQNLEFEQGGFLPADSESYSNQQDDMLGEENSGTPQHYGGFIPNDLSDNIATNDMHEGEEVATIEKNTSTFIHPSKSTALHDEFEDFLNEFEEDS